MISLPFLYLCTDPFVLPIIPSLIPGAQRLFLLSVRSSQGFCVSVFDNETVKNEAGGGNSSALERREAVLWQREARQLKMRRRGFFYVRPGMMKWMRFPLHCISRTGGRINTEGKTKPEGRVFSSICRTSSFSPLELIIFSFSFRGT